MKKYDKQRTLICVCGQVFTTWCPRTEGLICPDCSEKRRIERRRFYDELDNHRKRTGRPIGRPRKYPLDYNPMDPPVMKEPILRVAQPGGFAISEPGDWKT